MKIKICFLLLGLVLLGGFSFAQTKTVSALDQATAEVCEGLKGLDPEKATVEEIKTAFQNVMLKAFGAHMNELMVEMKMENMDGENGRKIGEEIGRRMLTKCPTYVMLAAKMTGSSSDDADVNSADGTISKINSSGDFVQIFVKDANGREQNYYWLKYFKGSEGFENGGLSNIGKKVKIQWSDIEYYIPKAKGYYKLKEIKQIDIL